MTLEEKGQNFVQRFLESHGSTKVGDISAKESPIRKMETEITHLCEELNSASFDVTHWLKEMSEFVDIESNRLLYSSITNFVFQTEQQDRISSNIKNAADRVLADSKSDKSKSEYSPVVRKAVLKIYDHVNLAIRQKALFEKKKDDLKDQIEYIVSPMIVEKNTELTKEMTTQLVALIAIFTALSFIVFGGISSLDSIFQSLQKTMADKDTVLPTLIVAIAWSLCLMNLLFGFMYFVLRIAKLQSPVNYEAKNLVQRYPVVFLCNFVLLLLLVVFAGMWFAECNGIGKETFDFFVTKHSEMTFFFASALIAVFFCSGGKHLYELFKGEKMPTEN